MIPGRKPKPDSLKALEGNPGGRKLRHDRVKPTIPIRSDAPPSWLNRDGKREWRRLAEELESQNCLTCWDHQTFAGYCNAVAMVIEARRHLQKPEDFMETTPNGFFQPSPWLGAMERWTKVMLTAGSLLGLNPAERSRLSISAVGTRDDYTEAGMQFGFEADGRPVPGWVCHEYLDGKITKAEAMRRYREREAETAEILREIEGAKKNDSADPGALPL